MELSIGELGQLFSMIKQPRTFEIDEVDVENGSMTLRVNALTGDTVDPFYIRGVLITELGVYNIDGVKYWVVSK